MRVLRPIALVLVIIGAVNWGLVGLFGFDLVKSVFGEMSALSRIVYTAVGVAGVLAFSIFGSLQTRRA